MVVDGLKKLSVVEDDGYGKGVSEVTPAVREGSEGLASGGGEFDAVVHIVWEGVLCGRRRRWWWWLGLLVR